MTLPTHINIAIWPNENYMDMYPDAAIARQKALVQIKKSLEALDSLFYYRKTTFNLVFFPSSSLAPTHYGNDYPQYAIQVQNAFVQQWHSNLHLPTYFFALARQNPTRASGQPASQPLVVLGTATKAGIHATKPRAVKTAAYTLPLDGLEPGMYWYAARTESGAALGGGAVAVQR